MAVSIIPDVSDATLGVALTLAWLIVLVGSLYQYGYGTRSREWFYLTFSAGALWLAFSLLQVSTAFAQLRRSGIVALAVVVFCTGIATGVRWWGLRNSGTDARAEA
jgi:hypothetical protein